MNTMNHKKYYIVNFTITSFRECLHFAHMFAQTRCRQCELVSITINLEKNYLKFSPVHVSCFTATSTGEYSPCSFNSCISTHNSIFLVNSDQRSASDLAFANCCCSTSHPGLLREKPALRWPHTSILNAPSTSTSMISTHLT